MLLKDVVRLVLIYCPNRHGIHKGIYIRYAILINKLKEAWWMDNPLEEDVTRIWTRVSQHSDTIAVASTCAFCKAIDGQVKSS